MKLSVFSVLGLLFLSCGESSSSESDPKSNEQVFEEEVVEETVEEVIELPSIDKNHEYTADIIMPGQMTAVEDINENSEWWGLFERNGKWRLEKTKIRFEAMHDPWSDEEGEMSGTKILPENEGNCLILWSDLDFLIEREVERIEIEKDQIYPSEEISFVHFSDQYTLQASGDEGEYGNVKNYTLSIKREAGQYVYIGIITEHEYFDDAMVRVLFLGDIDGDNIPDMIIEDSHKYSYSKPVILLSRPAETHKVLKRIGEATYYGC